MGKQGAHETASQPENQIQRAPDEAKGSNGSCGPVRSQRGGGISTLLDLAHEEAYARKTFKTYVTTWLRPRSALNGWIKWFTEHRGEACAVTEMVRYGGGTLPYYRLRRLGTRRALLISKRTHVHTPEELEDPWITGEQLVAIIRPDAGSVRRGTREAEGGAGGEGDV